MGLLPLLLSARRLSWRVPEAHTGEQDAAFASTRAAVLARDDYTCQYCGFRAPRWQEITHRNDNHLDNRPENLATACCLCHQCFHLGMAGTRHSGLMIWLPEIDQVDLHHVCRAIFVAVANRGKAEGAARSLYETLESRAQLVEQELGEGAASPAVIGQALLRMDDNQYADRATYLAGLRLLPVPGLFGQQTEYWRDHPQVFGALPDQNWALLGAASAVSP